MRRGLSARCSLLARRRPRMSRSRLRLTGRTQLLRPCCFVLSRLVLICASGACRRCLTLGSLTRGGLIGRSRLPGRYYTVTAKLRSWQLRRSPACHDSRTPIVRDSCQPHVDVLFVRTLTECVAHVTWSGCSRSRCFSNIHLDNRCPIAEGIVEGPVGSRRKSAYNLNARSSLLIGWEEWGRVCG
jgi:hypothetical protein